MRSTDSFTLQPYVDGFPLRGVRADVTVAGTKDVSVRVGDQHLCWPYDDFLSQLFRQSHVAHFRLWPTNVQLLTWDLFVGMKEIQVIGARRKEQCRLAG